MVTIGIIENAFLIRINGGITHSHNEKYREEFEALPFIADNDSPSKEVVLAAKPDLIIWWGSTFTEDTLGSVQDWNERGIATYIVDNAATGVEGKRTVDRLYNDRKLQ